MRVLRWSLGAMCLWAWAAGTPQIGWAQNAEGPAGIGAAPQPVDEAKALALRLQQVVEQVQSVREQQRLNDLAHRQTVEQFQRQIENLDRGVQAVEAAVDVQRQELEDLQKKLAAEQQAADEHQAWIAQAARSLSATAQRLRQAVEAGAGEQKIKRASAFIEALALTGEDREPPQKAEGGRGVFQALGDEWIAARNVSLSNEPILLDGGKQRQHAWVLRLGTAAQWYASEDQQNVGVWWGDRQGPWKLDPPAPYRQQVVELFEVVRETRPPTLTPTPVWLPARKPAAAVEKPAAAVEKPAAAVQAQKNGAGA